MTRQIRVFFGFSFLYTKLEFVNLRDSRHVVLLLVVFRDHASRHKLVLLSSLAFNGLMLQPCRPTPHNFARVCQVFDCKRFKLVRPRSSNMTWSPRDRAMAGASSNRAFKALSSTATYISALRHIAPSSNKFSGAPVPEAEGKQ